MKHFFRILLNLFKFILKNIFEIAIVTSIIILCYSEYVKNKYSSSNVKYTHNYVLVNNVVITKATKCSDKYINFCLYELSNGKKIYLPDDLDKSLQEVPITIYIRFSELRLELYTIKTTNEIVTPTTENILVKITKNSKQYYEYCNHFKIDYCMGVK